MIETSLVLRATGPNAQPKARWGSAPGAFLDLVQPAETLPAALTFMERRCSERSQCSHLRRKFAQRFGAACAAGVRSADQSLRHGEGTEVQRSRCRTRQPCVLSRGQSDGHRRCERALSAPCDTLRPQRGCGCWRWPRRLSLT